MKLKIFRPGFFSLIMIVLMMYLSCNKQIHTEVVPYQKLSAVGGNAPPNEPKWFKEPVMQLNNKSGKYIGNTLIKNNQDKDSVVTDMRLGSCGFAFHTFNYGGTTAAIWDIAFLKKLSKDYTSFTSIKSSLNY